MNSRTWKERMGSRLGIKIPANLVLKLSTFPVRRLYSISNTWRHRKCSLHRCSRCPLSLWFLPRWEIGKWSPCSLTCGVGLQTRDVFCSHLLSREMNETVILADELCRQPKPSTVQACNRFNCPPAWYPVQWQLVSSRVTHYWSLCLQQWFWTGDGLLE